MSEDETITKALLMADLEPSWSDLNADLAGLSEDQMSALTDAEGWTVVDHVTHLTAWLRSVTSLLRGRPRYAGLGIDKATYDSGDFDAMNAIIQRQQAGASPDEALAALRAAHADLLALLEGLDEAELGAPASQFTPGEYVEGKAPRTIDVVYGNSVGHYEEHRIWMRELIQ